MHHDRDCDRIHRAYIVVMKLIVLDVCALISLWMGY